MFPCHEAQNGVSLKDIDELAEDEVGIIYVTEVIVSQIPKRFVVMMQKFHCYHPPNHKGSLGIGK